MPQKKTATLIARLTQNPWIMAGLSLILGLAVSWRVGLLETERRVSEARSQTINDLAAVRARLEGGVNTVFSATSGLAEVIAHQGGIQQDLFEALARQAIKGHPQIRIIGVAPDNTLAMIYPLEGNRQAIGLRYASMPEQHATVRQAMDEAGIR